MKVLFLLALVLQGVIEIPGQGKWRWEWAKPDEIQVRDTWVLTERETQAHCFVAVTWFDDHLVQIHCPAPFSPYGVTFHRFCVVKPDQRLVRAKVVIMKDGVRDLWTCEVTTKE